MLYFYILYIYYYSPCKHEWEFKARITSDKSLYNDIQYAHETGGSICVPVLFLGGELLVVLRIQTTSDCVSWACVATPDTFRIESSRPVTEWRPSKTNRGAHLAPGAKNADSLRLEAWMSRLTRTRRLKRPPPPPPPALHNGTVGIFLFSFVSNCGKYSKQTAACSHNSVTADIVQNADFSFTLTAVKKTDRQSRLLLTGTEQ